MKCFVFYLFALVLAIGLQSVRSLEDCEARQEHAENLLRTVLRVDREDFDPIVTEEQMSDYCRNAKQGLIMFKSYGACLNGIGKQVFNILKRTTAKALRNHCVVNPQVTLEYFSCFQDTRLTRKYRKCIFKFGETLNYAADTASEDEIFSTLCCGFRSLSGCIDDAFLNNNGACTNPNINLRAYSKTLFKGLFGSVSDAFCSSYTEDICRSKMAKMELYAQDNNRLGLSNFSVIKDLVRLSEKLSS